MPIALAVALLLLDASAFAGSKLDLLKGGWREKCRPTTNEAGEVITTRPFQSLQSSYSRVDGGHLSWTVSSFKDAKCRTPYDSNRYQFKCEPAHKPTELHCAQTSWKTRQGDGPWSMKKPASDPIGMTISLQAKGKGKLELTTTSDETGDPETLELSK